MRKTYGCINYLPLVENEEAVRRTSEELAITGDLQQFRDTFPIQRQDIVQWVERSGSLRSLLDKWPLFRQPTYFLAHFECLVGFSATEKADGFLETAAEQLLQYWASHKWVVREYIDNWTCIWDNIILYSGHESYIFLPPVIYNRYTGLYYFSDQWRRLSN